MNRNLNKTNKTDKLLLTNTSGNSNDSDRDVNMTCINSANRNNNDLVHNNNNNYKLLIHAFVLIVFFILLLLSLIPVTSGADDSPPAQPSLPTGADTGLNLCQRCRLLTDSFQAGVERTARGKFEGGDTHWEEAKMGSYANSEIRLTEIQELLCSELATGKDQCHHLAEEYEPQIENWWFSRRQPSAANGQSLYDYLCMDQMKACCPAGHYGPDCKPCAGHPDHVCSDRGVCVGNGSRDGSGRCLCDSGFGGADCGQCANDHYANGTVADGQLPACEPCDKSCASGCRSGGPKGCLVCTAGYIWDGDYGCVDVDECVDLGVNPCESNAFCINTEGSFYCYQCDKACDGCNGDGPDSCLKCAQNHVLKDGICLDPEANKRETHISLARYATYLGLCVATCIIFRNNIYVASVIGLVVAVYITLSEFTLKDDVFNPLSNWAQAAA